MRSCFSILLSGALVLGASTVTADTLMVDAISQDPPNTESGLMRPKNGMTMDEVKKSSGENFSANGPVGDPPITSWTYDRFTVYFEYDRVITSVVHR
ncbi:MAG: hypothetical protein ACWA5Q_11350 [bacterium]